MRRSVTKCAAWLLGLVLAACGEGAPSPAAQAEARALFEQGREAIRRDDYKTAEDLLARAAELHPTSAEFQYALGIARYQRSVVMLGLRSVEGERLRAAQENFDRAIELDPAGPSAYAYHLYGGLARERAHQPEAAIPFFLEALRLNPDNIQARLRLGISYQVTQRADEARAELEQVLAREPGNGRAWHHLGLACQELEQWDRSLLALDRAVALAPTDPAPHFDRVESLRRLGRQDEADAAMEHFRELHDASQAQDLESIRQSMEAELESGGGPR